MIGLLSNRPLATSFFSENQRRLEFDGFFSSETIPIQNHSEGFLNVLLLAMVLNPFVGGTIQDVFPAEFPMFSVGRLSVGSDFLGSIPLNPRTLPDPNPKQDFRTFLVTEFYSGKRPKIGHREQAFLDRKDTFLHFWDIVFSFQNRNPFGTKAFLNELQEVTCS